MTPLKALVIMSLGEQRGGGEATLLDLVRHHERSGLELAVIYLEDGPMVTQTQQGGVHAEVLDAGRVRHAHRLTATVAKIAKRAGEYDVVLSWMTKAHLYGGPAALVARRPAVWFLQGVPRAASRLDRVATRVPARGVIAVSNVAATAQRKLRPVRDVLVVNPGVDVERFDPARVAAPQALRSQLGIPANATVVGIASRLQRSKGVSVFLEAVAAARESDQSIFAVVVGGEHALEPEYPAAMRTEIVQLGLDGHVLLAGLQRNVPEWMRAMDIVVSPGANEGFPLTVLETMAMARPVIACDSGGPVESIREGVDGWFFKTGDPASLAETILRLLADPDRTRAVADAARDRALEFSSERFAQRFGEALRQFVPGNGPA